MIGLARLMSAYQCIFPPPIPSPYTLNPWFADAFRQTLTSYVIKYQPKLVIEWGCAYGFSTSIIALALPPDAEFWVYDTFDQAPVEVVKANLAKVGITRPITFTKANIWYWLTGDAPPFDFMYLDASINETLMDTVYDCFKDRLNDCIILFEGALRLQMRVPHVNLIPFGPGLGRLLP